MMNILQKLIYKKSIFNILSMLKSITDYEQINISTIYIEEDIFKKKEILVI